MKSKYWAIFLTVLILLCAALSIPLLFPGEDASYAEIYSDGKLIRTVSLQIDQEFTVDTPGGGHNVVTVRDGKIAVTDANCPDHYCMQRGFCSSGSHIICLPNALVIEFTAQQEIDGFVG